MISANDVKRLTANVETAKVATNQARSDAWAIWQDAPDYEDLCDIATSLNHAYTIVCSALTYLEELTA